MKSLLLLPALMVCFSSAALSQTTGASLSGMVLDLNHHILSGATVMLLHPKDSSMEKTSVSGENGRYQFVSVKEGLYLLAVTHAGNAKTFTGVFTVKGEQPIVLAPILLPVNSQELREVTVTANKALVEQKPDRTIINVDASPTNAGATALEVLEKSPGVMVAQDGSISLRGKPGVTITIDGKPTYLSATDLANLLKNMPASSLSQIEIMTNPSAKFDASGNSGVINIKTKKGLSDGFNGSIMAGIGSSYYRLKGVTYLLPKSQNSFTFNLRVKKINLFGNYNPGIYDGRHTMYFDRKFSMNGTPMGTSDQETAIIFRNRNQSAKVGVDWFVNRKNVFGVVASGFIFKRHDQPFTTSHTIDEMGTLESTMISMTDNKMKFSNFSGNLNWKHNFDTAGTELSTDFDLVRYQNGSNMLLHSDFYNDLGEASGNLLLKGYLPSHIKIYSFKSDFTHPFKGGKLEAGIKSSVVRNDNIAGYSKLAADKWMEDDRSNHFIYEEQINAIYVNANKQVKKWNFQGGLRYEQTLSKGNQLTNNTTFRRNIGNLFPSSYLSYAVDKNNTLTGSYSRRINRPNYKDLNPFIYFLDSLTYAIGNPGLKPEFTNNLELSHAYKSKIVTTLNYSKTTDVISQVLRQKPSEKITFVTLENVSSLRNMGVSFTAPVRFSSWWNANLYANVYNNRYKGEYENKPIDFSSSSFLVNISNTFTLGKGYSAEFSGFYRHKGLYQLTFFHPQYQVNIGAQKQLLKEKATVRLSVRDPFGWQRFHGVTKYGDVDFTERNIPDSRQVSASFSYRFGKNKQAANQRRSNPGSQEEQNRVGAGN